MNRILSLISCFLFGFAGSLLYADGNGSSFTETQRLVLALDNNPGFAQKDCDELLNLTDFNVSIISARMVPAVGETPEHCLVYGVISPEIEFVVQLPTVWNGRLYVHGNGGDAGESVYGEFGKDVRNAAVKHGFIATFSNAGHDAGSYPGTSWAYNSLQREIDYSFRALHLNTVVVKNLSQIDGVISNPAAIDFDPVRDLPRDDTGRNGFTGREIEGLAIAYGGLVYQNQLIAEGIPVGAGDGIF